MSISAKLVEISDLIDKVEETLEQIKREIADLKQLSVERREAKIGDYVLATKWDDGDPCDHFFVGFLDSINFRTHSKGSTRYMVVDGDGYLARAGGFRRAEPITEKEGRELLKLFPTIANRPGKSLWRILDEIRNTSRES